MEKNKTGKYLKYAIGEIVLVVIGILIALQINNWNNNYQLIKKEKTYLIEIKNNLLIDKRRTEETIGHNNRKIAAIDTMMSLLPKAKNSNDYIEYLLKIRPLLCTFPTFEPIRIAFNNMMTSHSIDIIQNTELRTILSTYYNYNWERSSQSATRERTRNFAAILTEKIIDHPLYYTSFKEQLKPMLNSDNKLSWTDDYELDIKDSSHLEFHEDREAIASMFNMLPTSVYHSKRIQNAAEDIETILNIIENELQ